MASIDIITAKDPLPAGSKAPKGASYRVRYLMGAAERCESMTQNAPDRLTSE
jgi:hypothetical protein